MPHTPRHPLPADAVSLDLPADAMRHLTALCTQAAIAHVGSLESRPSWDLDGALEVASLFRDGPPADPAGLETLLPLLERAASKTFTTSGPGYLAFIPSGGLYPSALADYLALAYNRYVGVWNPAPALVQLELQCIDWISELAPG